MCTESVQNLCTESVHNFVYEKRPLGFPRRTPSRPNWVALEHAQKPQNANPGKAPTRINIDDKVQAALQLGLCVSSVYVYMYIDVCRCMWMYLDAYGYIYIYGYVGNRVYI